MVVKVGRTKMSYSKKSYIEKCRKVSPEKATTPKAGAVEIVMDAYWLMTPENEILYYCMQEGDMKPTLKQSTKSVMQTKGQAITVTKIKLTKEGRESVSVRRAKEQ